MEDEQAIEDPSAFTPPAEPPAEEPPPAEPPAEEPPVVHEPAPDHPRFTQIYGQMQQGKRDLAKADEAILALQEQNQRLSDAIDSVQDQVSKTERPDPLEDPGAYDDWIMSQMDRKLEKTRAPEPPPAPVQPPQPQVDPKLQVMDETMAAIHPDYYEVIEKVKVDMQTNPALVNQVFSAKNPAIEAYNYWQGKQQQAGQQRTDNINRGYAEGGTPPPGNPVKRVLTDKEKHRADLMNVSHEDWLKQTIFMEKRGY